MWRVMTKHFSIQFSFCQNICWIRLDAEWVVVLFPSPHVFPPVLIFFYKPLWPDTEPLRQCRWSHTPELWKASSVSPSRHAAWSLLTRENCTWTGINLDPVCEIGTASGGWRTFRGELWTPPCCFWSPASAHFLRHPRPYDQCLDRSAAGSYNSAGGPMVG